MSFIRAGSNPESLYVFGSVSGIEFYWNIQDKQLIAYASDKDWETLAKAFYKNPDLDLYDGALKFGSLTIRCVWYDEERDVIEADFGDSDYDPKFFTDEARNVHLRTCLNFGNKFADGDYGLYEYRDDLVMWDTTWTYLLSSATSRCKQDSLSQRFKWCIQCLWWQFTDLFQKGKSDVA